MQKRPGRPKLPKGEAKGATLIVRLQKQERKAVTVAARRAGVKPSEWIRQALLTALGRNTIEAAEKPGKVGSEAVGIEPHPAAYTGEGPGDVKSR